MSVYDSYLALRMSIQVDNAGRRAAEVIDELTDFGALRNITGDMELPPQVSHHFKGNKK